MCGVESYLLSTITTGVVTTRPPAPLARTVQTPHSVTGPDTDPSNPPFSFPKPAPTKAGPDGRVKVSKTASSLFQPAPYTLNSAVPSQPSTTTNSGSATIDVMSDPSAAFDPEPIATEAPTSKPTIEISRTTIGSLNFRK